MSYPSHLSYQCEDEDTVCMMRNSSIGSDGWRLEHVFSDAFMACDIILKRICSVINLKCFSVFVRRCKWPRKKKCGISRRPWDCSPAQENCLIPKEKEKRRKFARSFYCYYYHSVCVCMPTTSDDGDDDGDGDGDIYLICLMLHVHWRIAFVAMAPLRLRQPSSCGCEREIILF